MDAHIARIRIMKRASVTLAIAAIVVANAAPARTEDDLPVRNCAWCHGASGQGTGVAPALAGQRAQYLERELQSFRDHSRDDPAAKQYMWGATARLSPEMAHGFAHYFALQPAEAANDGDAELAASGKLIYEQGVPEANVVSCIVCHGPRGEGFEAIPRLGGMSYAYVKSRLEMWAQGYHAAAHPMPHIARTLSPHEIEALASYVSFLK
jgi:cytochrome c553